jgi:hypothetical protein
MAIDIQYYAIIVHGVKFNAKKTEIFQTVSSRKIENRTTVHRDMKNKGQKRWFI